MYQVELKRDAFLYDGESDPFICPNGNNALYEVWNGQHKEHIEYTFQATPHNPLPGKAKGGSRLAPSCRRPRHYGPRLSRLQGRERLGIANCEKQS